MIPCCVAYIADSCYPKGKYWDRFIKAESKISEADPLERCVTDLACGVLVAGCCVGYPYSQGMMKKVVCSDFIAGSYCFTAVCVTVNAGDSKRVFCKNGCLTTGCLRDCTVLQETFKNKPK